MKEILIDHQQKLTKEQCDVYAEYLMPRAGTSLNGKDYSLQPPKVLQKKLFHKIAQSHLHRSETTKEFMDKMLQKVW